MEHLKGLLTLFFVVGIVAKKPPIWRSISSSAYGSGIGSPPIPNGRDS